MKILSLIFILCSCLAQAATTYVDGSANESGLCSQNDFYYCSQNVKDRAKRSSLRDAELRCNLSGGKLELFSESYSDFCTPFSYPTGQPNTSVNCRVTCRARCQVP